MPYEYAIETRSLSRYYGAVVAVNNLNLTVPNGSVFGFLGPNGAGKTTTIRMLLSLIRPDSGSIILNNNPLTKNRKNALARVGAIVETPTLYANLTGWENLRSASLLINSPTKDIDRALDIVGLSQVANKRVGHYSLGMRQRLALARALLGDPNLLILDEPVNGLDPSGISEMRSLIRSLPKEYGATVLLSSHILSEVEQIADYCALINRGETIFQGRLKDLIADAKATLSIASDDPENTVLFLRSKGLAAEINDDFIQAPASYSRQQCAELLSQLNRDGHQISHFELKRPSLESLFLQMTSDRKERE